MPGVGVGLSSGDSVMNTLTPTAWLPTMIETLCDWAQKAGRHSNVGRGDLEHPSRSIRGPLPLPIGDGIQIQATHPNSSA